MMGALHFRKLPDPNEVKKSQNTVGAIEKIRTLPAIGEESDRTGAPSAAIARFMTSISFATDKAGIAVPFWSTPPDKRLWIPRASLPVKPLSGGWDRLFSLSKAWR